MQQVIAITVSAVLAGLGYLGQRWLRRDSLAEAIDRRLKLVTLYRRMSSAHLDEDDLERMERRLISSTKQARETDAVESGDP